MDAVELLRAMVSIPSPSGGEAELAAFLARCMEEMGYASHVDEVGNAVGSLGEGPREIVLLGHLDTVPGGPPVEIEGGRLYGRGSVDAKGPLAAFVVAMAALGAVPGWRIVVIGAVEEEAASSRGARHVARRRPPDACVIGEPSGWDGVTLGYKGRLAVEASLRRPATHSAVPEPSAAEVAVDLWNVVAGWARRYNEGRDRLFDQLQCRLESLDAGSDGDSDAARARLGFRLPPGLDPPDLLGELERLRDGLAGPRIALAASACERAYVADRGTALARSFHRAIRAAKARPRWKVKTGTSDMNVVGPAWRCPILAYGPGDSRLDHAPDEHLVLEEYLKAVEVLRRAVGGLTEPPVPLDSKARQGRMETSG